MENSNRTPVSIETLRKDINEQEELMNKFINKANKIFPLIIISVLLAIFSLIYSKFLLSSCFFIFAFIMVRMYNQSKGMAEVHNGLRKFLKMLLIQEQTGEDQFSKIIC